MSRSHEYKALMRKIRRDCKRPSAVKRSAEFAEYWREKRKLGPTLDFLRKRRCGQLRPVPRDVGYKMNDKRRYYREEYMKTDHWKRLRDGFMATHPICEVCGNPSQDAHHVVYKHLYNVNPSDLRAVCRSCHDTIHKLKDRGVFPHEDTGIWKGTLWKIMRKAVRREIYLAKKREEQAKPSFFQGIRGENSYCQAASEMQ